MSQVTITICPYWDRDEPDGSECNVCGESCYLSMWRLYVRSLSGRVLGACEAVMCDSCHQCLMEGD